MKNRSWTDLASNVTHLGSVQLADHLDDLLTPGKGPSSLLLGCLHEVTHHWCFLSPVGVTVTGLTFRMADAIAGDGNAREELVLRDLVAYRTVTALMRPLVEGLALFAEFDINSIKSPIFSRPLGIAASLFSGRAPSIRRPLEEGGEYSPEDVPEGLSESLPMLATLRTTRLSEVGIRRKVNVLAKSVNQDTDGYLLGYLGIKGMWRILRQKYGRLYSETDLAFTFLRSYFFDDRQLIEILITPRKESGEELANRIVNHVRGRINQLADVTPEDLETFECQILNGTPNESVAWAPCHKIPTEVWERGQRLYTELTTSLMAKPEEKSADKADDRARNSIHSAFSLMLERRHIVRLGAQEVRINVDHDGRFVVRNEEQELLRGRAPNVVAQSGDGTIELVFSTFSSGLYRAIAVYGPHGLVDILMPGIQPNDEDLEEELNLLRIQLVPSARFVELGDYADRIIDSFIDESGFASVLDFIQSQTPEIVKYLYLDIGLNTVPDERLDDAVQLLDAGGIYAFLSYDRDLLDALIILGVVAPLMPFRRLVLQELANRGFSDPEAIFRDLIECYARTGLAMVDSDEERVLVQI